MGDREKTDYSKMRECCNCVHGHVVAAHTEPGKDSAPALPINRTFCVKAPPITHAVFVNAPGRATPLCWTETTYPEPPFACSQFAARGAGRG